MPLADTIVAISTPPGRGGLGVVRLSGASARDVAGRFLSPLPEWQPWRASLVSLVDASGNVIDHVVATTLSASIPLLKM
ncbi:MAG: hypothetical protein WKF37_04960 [Bryobacteraceae bacterium]